MKNNFLFGFVVMLVIGSGVLYAQSLKESEAAARDAVKRLDEALSGKSSGGKTGGKTGGSGKAAEPAVQAAKGGAEPVWVTEPYKAYSKDRYLVGVGVSPERETAEKKALAALSAVFGISIQSDFSAVSTYSEAVSKGIITVSENTSVRDAVITSASLDNLIGAEIVSVWEDGKGSVYALACMEKEKAVTVYTAIINVNQININRLTAVKDEQKYTFDGYARFKMAALVAGLNEKYAVIITQAGGQTAGLKLDSAGALNTEAANILKKISVSITVEGDQKNRIKYAFAKVLNNAGIKTQDSGAPYVLEVTVTLNPVTVPNSNNAFCEYTVNANFMEKASGLELLPFNNTGRTSHLTYDGARDRAVAAVEKIIGSEYAVSFKECLAGLMPRK